MDVGDVLPSLERQLGSVDLVAYAGATWDWNRLHYDAEYLGERGLPAPVVDGQMFGALLAEQVQDALGPRCRILRMGFRYQSMVFAGETVKVLGEVEAVEGDVVRLRQWIEASGEPGKKEDVVDAVRETLTEAIAKGGSTLRDYVDSAGEPGYFQLDYYVYGREGEPCRICGSAIRSVRQGGRATAYCGTCQR